MDKSKNMRRIAERTLRSSKKNRPKIDYDFDLEEKHSHQHSVSGKVEPVINVVEKISEEVKNNDQKSENVV